MLRRSPPPSAPLDNRRAGYRSHGHSRSPAELRVMRTLKQALDPKGILNPGKVFDV
jgi:FAD/FMN-containing dehydrogenase